MEPTFNPHPSVAKPAVPDPMDVDMQTQPSGAAPLADVDTADLWPIIVAFYVIQLDNGHFSRGKTKKLGADIKEARTKFQADIVLLSGCGEIGKGLERVKWERDIAKICHNGFDGFDICHQSHYTSIVRLSTITPTKYASLQCPLSK